MSGGCSGRPEDPNHDSDFHQRLPSSIGGRIDWKYALCLPLDNLGFDASVLSEFRARLLAGEAEARLYDTLLGVLRD